MWRFARTVFRALPCCGIVLAATAPVRAESVIQEMGQGSRPLSRVLADLARQTGTELLFDAALVQGLRARPVRGRPRVDAALRQLLTGTGIGYRRTRDGAYILYPLVPSPPPPAEDLAAPEILVIGRRSQNADIRRTENDIQPYQVVTSREIEAAHRDNVDQFLRARLPANADIIPPLLDTILSPGQVQSRVDLRGIGSGRTLVLVDGRRLPSLPAGNARNFDQADLNGIPLGAIERIETLTSTAGGIYGPGATGGVLNVVLRRDYQGADLTVTSGISDRGDAARVRIEGRIGFTSNDGATQAMLFASYAWSDPLLSGQRDYTVRARGRAIDNDPAGYIFQNGIPGFTPVSDAILIVSADGSPLRLDPEYGGTSLDAFYTLLPLDFQGSPEERAATLVANTNQISLGLSPGSSGAQRYLVNNPSVLSAIFSARHSFGGEAETFLDGLYFRNHGQARFANDPARVITDADAPGNPFAQRVFLRFPTELTGAYLANIDMWRLVGGVIAPLPGDWRAVAEFAYGRVGLRVDRSYPEPNATIYSAALRNGLPGPDGRPALRPLDGWEAFQSALQAYVRPEYLKLRQVNHFSDLSLRLAGPILDLPGGPLSATLLAERRREEFPRVPIEQNVLPLPTFRTPYQDRRVWSAYGEIRAPLLSHDSRMLPLRGLELQLAARYDAFRATFPLNGNLLALDDRLLRVTREALVFTFGGRAFPLRNLMLRGSYATGTVPPEFSAYQSAEDLVTSPQGARDPQRGGSRLGTEGPFVVIRGGSNDIRQEFGSTISVGAVVNPEGGRGPRLSIDYSRISIRREVEPFPLDVTALLLAEATYPERVTRAPLTDADRQLGYTAGRVLRVDTRAANSGRTVIHAIDIDLDWRIPDVLGGDLSPYARITWQPSIRSRPYPGAPWRQRIGYYDGPLAWRGNAGLSWGRGPAAIDLNVQYFDGYRLTSNDPGLAAAQARLIVFQGRSRIPAQVYVDLAGSWRFDMASGPVSTMEARLGVVNLFDRSPPIVADPAGIGYSPYGDPRRRRFELAVSARF